MLRLPIIAAEESNKIVFKEVAFFVIVKAVENELHHVLVNHETGEDVVGSHPFIECYE